jgi:flagellar biosynthesis/type III secretory pathway protein FliH
VLDQPVRQLSPVAIGLVFAGAVAFGAILGFAASRQSIRQEGYRVGVEDGREAGWANGYDEGLKSCLADAKIAVRERVKEQQGEHAAAIRSSMKLQCDVAVNEIENSCSERLASLGESHFAELNSVRSQARREKEDCEGAMAECERATADCLETVSGLESDFAELRDRYDRNRADLRDINTEIGNARRKGRAAGLEAGKKQGYQDGYRVGYREGFDRGRRGAGP